MDEPFGNVLVYLRKMLYKEKQKLKQLIAGDLKKNAGYIQFTQGKIFQLDLNIEKVLELKAEWYQRAKDCLKP